MAYEGNARRTEGGELQTAVTAGIATVTLNRPRVLNALNPVMVDMLSKAVQDLDRDPEVIAVVLTGAGRSFCAGADIRWESEADTRSYAAFIDSLQMLTLQLRESAMLVIAAIRGSAVGGGAELALACDMRVAATDATIGFPEVELGLTVTGGATYFLPRAVGPSRGLALLLTGDSLSAEEARAIGLIDAVDDDPIAVAKALVRRVATTDKDLIGLIKRSLYTGETGDIDRALRNESETILTAFQRPAAVAGLQAFLDRRRSARAAAKPSSTT